ncbi:MAG TPA: hypothetical protein VFX48_02080 [Saprospiraceae bacterium]|nr:hypothetical protein [Saprospiraceae bacterium]
MKNEQLQRISLNVIQTIQTQALPDEIKSALTDPELLKNQESLFLCFAQAFMDAFPGIPENEQVLINTITYLGARGIYEADPVYDIQIQGPEIQKHLVHSHFYHCESQRLLSHLFPIDHPLWAVYYQRYWQHFGELRESRMTDKRLDFKTYLQLLRYKYAMLYVPIDIMHYRTGQQYRESYERICEALQWFTVGYNIPNEIRGLKIDLETHINNYAWWRLMEKLPELDIDYRDYSSEELHKLVYVTGLAERMLEESLEAFEKALACIRPLNLPLFEYIIHKRIENNKMEMEILQEHLSSIF